MLVVDYKYFTLSNYNSQMSHLCFFYFEAIRVSLSQNNHLVIYFCVSLVEHPHMLEVSLLWTDPISLSLVHMMMVYSFGAERTLNFLLR